MSNIPAIIELLEKEYPEAECSLEFTKDYELLFATRLAAQCTDARVNTVTPTLYSRYPTLEALATADIGELEDIIHSCGFYHSKARDIILASQMLLSGRPDDAPGTCVTCVMEGARPVLAEVQALIAPSSASNPRRTSNGFDFHRAAMLLAVLEKRGGLKVSQCDAYLNIIGGLNLDDPAADLAAVMAIASSYLDKPVPNTMAAIGEVGLSGEIRSINHLEQRLSEVERLGFTQCLIPANRSREIRTFANLKLIPAKNVAQALQILVHGHHS